MNLWFHVTAYVICSTTGLLIIKDAMNIEKLSSNSLFRIGSILRLFIGGNFLIGFFLYIIGFFIWLYILSRHDLSLAFPIVSGALYLGLLIGSVFWLNEGVGIIRISGVFLILAGIILVSQS